MTGLPFVALGGAIGASGRYLLGIAMFKIMRPGFPWGTLTANILGGFLMGLLVGWLALKVSGGEHLRLFLAVGVLGGFTTFSSFSLEVVRMIETRHLGQAMGYIGSSVFFSVLAVFIGLWLARRIFAL